MSVGESRTGSPGPTRASVQSGFLTYQVTAEMVEALDELVGRKTRWNRGSGGTGSPIYSTIRASGLSPSGHAEFHGICKPESLIWHVVPC